jgi:hypothetical protein
MQTHKNALVFALSLGAVVSITTFSGIGVAAITGHLSIGNAGISPFYAIAESARNVAALVPPPPSGPLHTGLTRQSGTDPVQPGKPLSYRPGQRIAKQPSVACDMCGIVDSIESRQQVETRIVGGSHATAALPGIAGMGGPMVLSASGSVYTGIHSQHDYRGHSYVVRVKMEDGTILTVYESQRPGIGVGDRVRLVNGAFIPTS